VRYLLVALVIAAGCAAPAQPGPTTILATTSSTVVTAGRLLIIPSPFVEETDLYRVEVTKPVVDGVPAAPSINDTISTTVDAGVRSFVDVAVDQGTVAGLGKNLLVVDYGLGIVSDALMSIELRFYTEWSGAAHGAETIDTVTLDVTTGAPIDVAALIVDRAAFAALVVADVADRFYAGGIDEADQEVGGVDGVFSKGRFLLGEDAIVVLFDQYAVAAGAAGVVRVELPYAELRGIVDPSSLPVDVGP
jgi:hypothetical protein